MLNRKMRRRMSLAELECVANKIADNAIDRTAEANLRISVRTIYKYWRYMRHKETRVKDFLFFFNLEANGGDFTWEMKKEYYAKHSRAKKKGS